MHQGDNSSAIHEILAAENICITVIAYRLEIYTWLLRVQTMGQHLLNPPAALIFAAYSHAIPSAAAGRETGRSLF
jgi:hypothetical protein